MPIAFLTPVRASRNEVLLFVKRFMRRMHGRQFHYPYDLQPGQKTDDGIHGVYLKPPLAEIDGRRVFVVVVVIAFSQHQHINEKQVHRRVLQFEIDVTVFVREPVHDGSVKGAHGDDHR